MQLFNCYKPAFSRILVGLATNLVGEILLYLQRRIVNLAKAASLAPLAATLFVFSANAQNPEPRYRIFVPATKAHLYTTDKNENDYLTKNFPLTYLAEGIDHKIFKSTATVAGRTTTPYFRLYINPVKQHFWTLDKNEYDVLRLDKANFSDEGVDGHLFAAAGVANTIPLYRLALKDTAIHHWTTDANEFSYLVSTGAWVAEGALGNPLGVEAYVFPKDFNPVIQQAFKSVFIDSRTGGLNYTCGDNLGTSGVTDADGVFNVPFLNSTCKFYIGKVLLFDVIIESEATTFTAAQKKGYSSQYLANVAGLMQALDIDGNPDNGILIQPAIANAPIFSSAMNFEVDPAAFRQTYNVDVMALTLQYNGRARSILSPETAEMHYQRGQFLGSGLGLAKAMRGILYPDSFSNEVIPVYEAELKANNRKNVRRYLAEQQRQLLNGSAALIDTAVQGKLSEAETNIDLAVLVTKTFVEAISSAAGFVKLIAAPPKNGIQTLQDLAVGELEKLVDEVKALVREKLIGTVCAPLADYMKEGCVTSLEYAVESVSNKLELRTCFVNPTKLNFEAVISCVEGLITEVVKDALTIGKPIYLGVTILTTLEDTGRVNTLRTAAELLSYYHRAAGSSDFMRANGFKLSYFGGAEEQLQLLKKLSKINGDFLVNYDYAYQLFYDANNQINAETNKILANYRGTVGGSSVLSIDSKGDLSGGSFVSLSIPQSIVVNVDFPVFIRVDGSGQGYGADLSENILTARVVSGKPCRYTGDNAGQIQGTVQIKFLCVADRDGATTIEAFHTTKLVTLAREKIIVGKNASKPDSIPLPTFAKNGYSATPNSSFVVNVIAPSLLADDLLFLGMSSGSTTIKQCTQNATTASFTCVIGAEPFDTLQLVKGKQPTAAAALRLAEITTLSATASPSNISLGQSFRIVVAGAPKAALSLDASARQFCVVSTLQSWQCSPSNVGVFYWNVYDGGSIIASSSVTVSSQIPFISSISRTSFTQGVATELFVTGTSMATFLATPTDGPSACSEIAQDGRVTCTFTTVGDSKLRFIPTAAGQVAILFV